MAITSNNVQNVRFLRNGSLFGTRERAKEALEGKIQGLSNDQDGSVILARYQEAGEDVKTLAGFIYATDAAKSITIFDVDASGGDVDEKIAALRTEINNELGTGITSANTATAQLVALSGDSSTDTSATTSVEGAKKYAKDYTDKQIGDLDYTGVTTGTGVYVTNVTEVDGVVAATTATLPTVGAISENGKPITAVAEDKGTISASAGTIEAQYVNITDSGDKFTATTVEGALAEVKDAISGLDYSDSAVAKKFVIKVDETDGVIGTTKGSITSSAGTIVLSDNSDGGVNFDVHIDGVTILKNSETGELSVANSALIQYVGDNDTVQVSEAVADVKTISSPLTISATTPTETNVKEQYNLVGASGNTIGATIKIYKDSSLYRAYLGHVDDTIAGDPPVVTSGTGDTALCFIYHKEDGSYELVAVNVESFLEESEFASGVTADSSTHIVHGVVDPTSESFLTVGAGGFKLSGVQGAIDTAISGLDADVSGNSTHVTVGVEEVNGKITAVTVSESNIANTDDLTNEIAARKAVDGQDGQTYAANSGKAYISGATSLNDADIKLNDALASLDADVIKSVEVNNVALTESSNAVNVQISSTPASGTTSSPIVVNTDANGAVTLQILQIDCGEY